MKYSYLLLVIPFLLLQSCGDTVNGKAMAEPEVARFHERLNAKDFDAIYQASGEGLKDVASKAKFLALLAAIDRKLGPLQETKQINWKVNTYNLTTTVGLVYSSKFKEGEATETFTFKISNEKPELVGYNISSTDMMTK